MHILVKMGSLKKKITYFRNDPEHPGSFLGYRAIRVDTARM